MSLFGKKKEAESCCGGATPESMAAAEADKTAGAWVKVLGSGCAKCNALEAAAAEALAELGMDQTIDHVRDFSRIASYGVMTTPALVLGGHVVSAGKVLKKEEVVALIKKEEEKNK